MELHPQIVKLVWNDSGISEEMLEKIKPGIYISGLTYSQLLQLEEKIKTKLGPVRILFTGTGYGFVSDD